MQILLDLRQRIVFLYLLTQTRQPYYDMYPLTYVIEMRSNGFLGCNLHYVQLTQRDELATVLNNSAQGAVAVPPRTLHKYVYTA